MTSARHAIFLRTGCRLSSLKISIASGVEPPTTHDIDRNMKQPNAARRTQFQGMYKRSIGHTKVTMNRRCYCITRTVDGHARSLA
jgi:hypothetical protein